MTDEEAMKWVVDIALAMDESDGDMQANVLAAKVKAIAAAERERIAVYLDEQAAFERAESVGCKEDDCHAWARDASERSAAAKRWAAEIRKGAL